MITTRAGQRSLLHKLKTDEPRSLPRLPFALAAALSVAITLLIARFHGFLDLQVYRVDTRSWLYNDTALYGPTLPVAGHTDLPFTYPPSAAILMTPLAMMPMWLAQQLLTASSLACLGVTIWLVLSRVRPDLDPRTKLMVTMGAGVVLLAIEPVRISLWFGQINMVLMAAVALDCLTEKPRWPRGLLVGIAAVTKLTPAAFILYFLIRRDWKTAATSAGTAAAVVAGGFVLFPTESRDYWFHAVTDTRRIGSPDYVGNQSIKGLIFRLGLPDSVATAAWLVLALIAVGAGAALMHHLFAIERDTPAAIENGSVSTLSVAALFVNAAVLLLISPVSWTHHWVWAAPGLVAATAWATRNRSTTTATLITVFALLFLIGPGIVPNGNNRERDWSWWQYIPGDIYIIAATALLAFGLWRVLARRPRTPAGSPELVSEEL